MARGRTYPSQYEQEHFVLENLTLLSGADQHFLRTSLLGDPLPGHAAGWAELGGAAASWPGSRDPPPALSPWWDTRALEQILDLSQQALSPANNRRESIPISCLSAPTHCHQKQQKSEHPCKEAVFKMRGILDRGNYTWLDRCSGMGRESQSYAPVVLQGVSKGTKAIE